MRLTVWVGVAPASLLWNKIWNYTDVLDVKGCSGKMRWLRILMQTEAIILTVEVVMLPELESGDSATRNTTIRMID